MARLDASTLATATVAQHLSDHNQLHTKANYVYDVMDYGATGDGTTDDATAIQSAATAAAATGGILYVPAGDYRITTTITISSYVTVMGAAPGADIVSLGSRILPDTQDMAAFTVGANTSMVGFSDLTIAGDGIVTGMVGILLQGAAASGSTKGLWIRHIRFYRLNKGIYANTTSGQWQISHVEVSVCAFNEITASSIHINSQNADNWRIFGSQLYSSATGVYLERSGNITISETVGSGNAGADDVFLRLTATSGPTVMIGCQNESADHFVKTSGGVGSYGSPLTLISCTVDHPITIDENWKVTIIGCNFNSVVNATATDVIIVAIGNHGATYNLTGNSTAIQMDGSGANFDMYSIGFYGAAPVAQQTGVAVSAAGIHAALVNLGLITA